VLVKPTVYNNENWIQKPAGIRYVTRWNETKWWLKCETCIAVTNSVKPKNPCLLTSARAQSRFSWERDKLERAKNFVVSFPEIRPSPSTVQFQISKSKWIVSISNSEVSKIIEKRLTWIYQIKPFLIRLCFLFRTRFDLHLRRDFLFT